MNDYLVRAGDGIEFPTRERVFITERLNDPASPGISLADARVEPGVTTELHCLDVDEIYVIRGGQGQMEVNGEAAFAVKAGDSVVIPAGISQRISNTGECDLILQCICRPRFRPEGYTALESDPERPYRG